jgi:hypothetical protein
MKVGDKPKQHWRGRPRVGKPSGRLGLDGNSSFSSGRGRTRHAKCRRRRLCRAALARRGSACYHSSTSRIHCLVELSAHLAPLESTNVRPAREFRHEVGWTEVVRADPPSQVEAHLTGLTRQRHRKIGDGEPGIPQPRKQFIL